MSTIRAFVALEIPPSHRRILEVQRRALESELPAARWVPPGNQHLTLKFLGAVERKAAGRMMEDLAVSVGTPGAVEIELKGGGFFPNQKRPRVAWIGGRAPGAGALVEKLEWAAARHGFDRDRKPWSLHLTQARIKAPWSASHVQSFMSWADRLGLEPYHCGRLILHSSELRPTGAVYTALEEVQLT